MSDPTAARPTYDPNELRRCIALCFTTKDLRALAESLGATELTAWDRGIQEAAREVVRHFERLGTLDRLVAKLTEARPLVEWPAPLNGVAPSTETNSPSFAPPAVAAPPKEAPDKPVETPPAASAPVIRDPYAPTWPGTKGQAPAPERVEGKKLAFLLGVGLGLVGIIGLGIFVAARAGKKPETASAPSGELYAGRPLRPSGPARMAADAMKRSFDSLARGCDLNVPPGMEAGVWLFAAAYEQCGSRPRIEFPAPGTRLDPPIRQNDPSDPPPDEPAPAVPRQTSPDRDVAPKPAATPTAKSTTPEVSSGCIDKCGATQRQCNRACGSEPTSSAAYDKWQSCQTQCLSAASKCRLACR